ncbi:MAG: TIGR01212 family radical SAM protein [Candidatus Sumerlaeota bacterium]
MPSFRVQNKSSRPWNALAPALRSMFGCRVYRAALDLGFSCPNRDGTLATGGCRFCDAGGSRAQYVEPESTIEQQIKAGIARATRRKPETKVIAYFQAFSGTHGPLDQLRAACETVLQEDKVVAIAIATRPDCLPTEALDFLSGLQERTLLWVELGLQTTNDQTLQVMGRGHDVAAFARAAGDLREREIRFVGHVVAGLPGDSAEDTIRAAGLLNEQGAWGVKLHNLYIDEYAPIAADWKAGRVETLDEAQYREIAVQFLGQLHPDVLVHRLVGHAPPSRLLAPEWCLDKQGFLRRLEETMRRRDLSQGSLLGDL